MGEFEFPTGTAEVLKLPGKQGRMSALYGTALFEKTDELEVGSGLEVTIREWPLASIPNAFQLNVAHKSTGKRFRIKTLPLQKGMGSHTHRMTEGYRTITVPTEVYEIFRAVAFRRHVSMARIMRDLAATLTASKRGGARRG
jgi:hypothetical protein